MTTPPALQPVDDLRRAAALLAASRDAAGERVAERLRYYLEEAPRGLAIEVALEVPPGPWWSRGARSARDALIYEIARRYFPGESPPQAAAGIDSEWRQYCRCQRKHDLQRGYSNEPAGSLRAMLFELAALGKVPGQRQLANILRADDTSAPQVIVFPKSGRK